MTRDVPIHSNRARDMILSRTRAINPSEIARPDKAQVPAYSTESHRPTSLSDTLETCLATVCYNQHCAAFVRSSLPIPNRRHAYARIMWSYDRVLIVLVSQHPMGTLSTGDANSGFGSNLCQTP